MSYESYEERVMGICKKIFQDRVGVSFEYEPDAFFMSARLRVFFFNLHTWVILPLPDHRASDEAVEGSIRHEVKEALGKIYLNPKGKQ